MKTTRLLTTLAAAAFLLVPSVSAIGYGYHGHVLDFDDHVFLNASASCGVNSAYANGNAQGGAYRSASANTWGSQGSGTPDGQSNSDTVLRTSYYVGPGPTHADASAHAGGQSAFAACHNYGGGPSGWGWPSVAEPVMDTIEKAAPLPAVGCETGGDGDHLFSGVMGLTRDGRWVLTGLLDGLPVVLPAGSLSASTVPLDVKDVLGSDVPVVASFGAHACDVVVGTV